MARTKKQGGKGPGRPKKKRVSKDYQHRRRHGMWPRGASSSDQLMTIVRTKGKLYPPQVILAAKLPELCTERYENEVNIKQSGATAYEIFGTSEGEKVLDTLARALTGGMKPCAPNNTDRPWILETRGACSPHTDFAGKGVFSLVICLQTDKPYKMLISYRKDLLVDDTLTASHYREVTMDTNSYLVFPSCVYHKCVAAEDNCRVIVNTLVREE